jgi:hypothetical protein
MIEIITTAITVIGSIGTAMITSYKYEERKMENYLVECSHIMLIKVRDKQGIVIVNYWENFSLICGFNSIFFKIPY